MKRIIIFLLLIIASIVLVFTTLLIFITIMKYNPKGIDVLWESEKATTIDKDTLSFVSWNIGYAGLDAGMDFFYDGGKRTRTTEDQYRENLQSVVQYLKHMENADFILLQEVDKNARRSYYTDQATMLCKAKPMHFYAFAFNYKVSFVPVPLANPMGKVSSGLLSISRPVPSEALRVALPGNYAWPKRLFMPDRCLLLERFTVKSGELVVINLHNSAFDKGGKLRQQQLILLRGILLEEYGKGNYVVCGGDWNQNPPGYDVTGLIWDDRPRAIDPPLGPDFLPSGWTYAWASNAPTNRDVDEAYTRGSTPTTTIDFFVLSPNIESLKTEALDLRFMHSDHNPVLCRIQLKQ